MEDVDREISEMKLSLNARARVFAESYLSVVRVSSEFFPSSSLTITARSSDRVPRDAAMRRGVRAWAVGVHGRA